ncbi:hypothetical protein [Mycobacterium sp.]|jgi:hypothetical protein|uniref:hypothetical protein n=1 Tax=Mycobacterium sp. TaxID=1785 RepID=UPI002EF8A4A3
MWCASVSLSVWANAWLAGSAAPDDVLDALSLWAPKHLVAAYDSVTAGHTGLPWPDLDEASAVMLLQTLRTTAARPGASEASPSALRASGSSPISVVLPVPGDVRGLTAGTQFEHDALAAGEAVIVAGPRGTAIGLVPEFDYGDDESDADSPPRALVWTVYSLPAAPLPDHPDLGEAEYALRSAVRSAADAFGAIRPGFDIADPRGMVEQLLESASAHRVPEDAPSRALRVLENAAHVDAILAVSSGAQIASDAFTPLSAVVRSARMAAVNAILQSAWRR